MLCYISYILLGNDYKNNDNDSNNDGWECVEYDNDDDMMMMIIIMMMMMMMMMMIMIMMMMIMTTTLTAAIADFLFSLLFTVLIWTWKGAIIC